MSYITMAEFIKLSEAPGPWAVYVQFSGYDINAPMHGTPYWKLHSRGLNKDHADLIARNWKLGGYPARLEMESVSRG